MSLLRSMLDWVYPPLCLHCKKERKVCSSRLYCSFCIDHFILLSVRGRCTKCFSPYSSEQVCPSCREKKWRFSSYAACFDAMGPAKSLFLAFSVRKQHRFSKDIGAFLALQHLRLCEERLWKEPQVIFELPKLFDPMQHNLGKAASFFFQISYSRGLKRTLSSTNLFSLKKKCNIQGQSVLLVLGGNSSFEILSTAAEMLRAEGATRVNVLSFLQMI